jgi:hypothetical protein
MVPHSSLAAAALALTSILSACRPTSAPAAIDPALSSCITANTVLLAGLNLDRLRATPLDPKLAPLEPLRNASYLLVASDGKNLVWIARGTFRGAPPGATLINPNLAISGPPESVRGAIAQHATGTTGAPGLLSHAAAIASSAQIWAVAQGGITLPLTGNAANLNRLLRLVDYATLAAKLDARLAIDLTGVCRNPDAGQRLEETLRAILSLAGAANPRLDPILRAAEIRREGATVHATLSTDPDSAGKLIDGLTR